ncbi:MAG: hypothetical protein KKH91_03915 [Elusimicrobia bacterium]|nr:hypothetical protein [Elusimicrobiota bacterium]MBU2614027.1 hypothetical protein [Elusimicrobiota bacterium]
MKLLLLAPDIQEEILLNTTGKMLQLNERLIKKIPLEIYWDKQREMWKNITSGLSE